MTTNLTPEPGNSAGLLRLAGRLHGAMPHGLLREVALVAAAILAYFVICNLEAGSGRLLRAHAFPADEDTP